MHLPEHVFLFVPINLLRIAVAVGADDNAPFLLREWRNTVRAARCNRYVLFDVQVGILAFSGRCGSDRLELGAEREAGVGRAREANDQSGCQKNRETFFDYDCFHSVIIG